MKYLFASLITILFLSNISECQVQFKFASKYLEDLYNDLPKDCKLYPDNNSLGSQITLSTNKLINNQTTKLNYFLNSNIIEDIGISIWDSTNSMLLKSKDVNRFLERKVLELLLIKNDNSITKKINEDKLLFAINGNSIANRIMLQKAYKIMVNKSDLRTKIDSLNYELEWTNLGNENVLFSFPANNNLIRSKDKKELDEEIITELSIFQYNWKGENKIEPPIGSLNKSKDNIYYRNEEFFYLEEINNKIYYKLENGELSKIFDSNYPIESFCNLIQDPVLNIEKKIKLEHRVYGNELKSYVVRFSDLIGYFKNFYTMYTGIETEKGNELKAIVIIKNNQLNFINMMVIDVNKRDLFDKDEIITASFHTNIPIDNIQNLFSNYVSRDDKFKIKIK